MPDSVSSTAESHTVLRQYHPGDFGFIANQHGAVYAEEYGFGMEFERYVLDGLLEYIDGYDDDTHCLWIAELEGEPVGSIAIVGRSAGSAQLRWLLVEPSARGQGIGGLLVEKALEFCEERRLSPVYLWTLEMLSAARQLYERFNFELTETKTHEVWGHVLTEERWEKRFS